jgi:hypothetical protein
MWRGRLLSSPDCGATAAVHSADYSKSRDVVLLFVHRGLIRWIMLNGAHWVSRGRAVRIARASMSLPLFDHQLRRRRRAIANTHANPARPVGSGTMVTLSNVVDAAWLRREM